MTLRRLRIAQDESLPKFLSNYDLDERREMMAQILAEDDIEGRRTSLILRAVNAAAAEPDF